MFVLLLALGCGSPAEPPPAVPTEPVEAPAPTDEQVTQEVLDFVEYFRTTVELRKPDKVRELYTTSPDFYWLEGGKRTFSNPMQIVEIMGSIPPHARVNTKYSDIAVTRLGNDHASVRMQYDTVATFPGRPDVQMSGVLSLTLERWSGGWRILNGHGSVPPAPPADVQQAPE
jgi:hypothetical protein